MPPTVEAKRTLIEPENEAISVRRQCELVGLNRSSWYLQPGGESELNLYLMRLLDEQYLLTPFFGWPRMTAWLQAQGYKVNGKRVRRLLSLMGLQAIYTRPKTTQRDPNHRIYPYLLRHLAVERPNQVWAASDAPASPITYVPMPRGFMYLVVIMDWFSRYVLAWQLSNTLDTFFCHEALTEALRHGKPEIFNTDQGVQFTARSFTSRLEAAGIAISMDGRGRAFDNIFIERLWQTVKYGRKLRFRDIYIKDYATVLDLDLGLLAYFPFYNNERPHQSLGYRTPAEVYLGTPQLAPGQPIL